jgi:antitoxin VbhA-like protein
MSTAAAPRAITVSEGLLRREAVENAIADLRLEGLTPAHDVKALLEQFVRGEVTEEQLVAAVLAR